MSELDSVEKFSPIGAYMFEYQAPVTLNQAAPVQDTWYPILDTTAYVRVYQISVNIADTNETLEVEVTVDGQTLTGSVAATHTTSYAAVPRAAGIVRTAVMVLFVDDGTWWERARAFCFDGHSVRIRVRKTTAAGAGNLMGIVNYGVLKRAF